MSANDLIAEADYTISAGETKVGSTELTGREIEDTK